MQLDSPAEPEAVVEEPPALEAVEEVAEVEVAETTETAAEALEVTPEEFGDFCAFLCSMQAGYMTGQNVLADGGAYPGTY